MSARERPSQSETAADLMARLESDPARVSRRHANEAERQARTQALREAQQPILADLAGAGYPVDSVWSLHKYGRYPDALPVLLKHLRRGGYPDRVMEGMAQAFAVKWATPFWPALRDLYLVADGPGEMEGLAAALRASVTTAYLDEMIALLDAEDRGDTRILFLQPIKRLGKARGLEVVESLRDDSTFCQEAQRLLKKRS